MKKYVFGWFYGIYGIEYIPHGEWSDPELIWHNKSFNYFDVENALWSYYREEYAENGAPVDENVFSAWVKRNAYLAREILQNLLECKCFYGSSTGRA
jgi:hypothetical protein